MKNYDERYREVLRRIDSEKRKEHYMKKKIIIAAAAVMAATALGITGGLLLQRKNPEEGEKTYNIIGEKHVCRETESCGEIGLQYPWEKLPDVSRYAEVLYNGQTYVTKLIALHEDHQGESLGEATARGQDMMTDEIKTTTVQVGEITGISEKCAISVRFNETDEYPYAYVAADYEPETMEQFISDLNLREELTTDLCFFESGPEVVGYEDIGMDMIWEMLLNDTSPVNEPHAEPHGKAVEMSVAVNVLGYHNHALWLTEDGYLCTNILETGKYFRIGEEKVKAFIDEVRKHTGYRLIFEDPTGPGAEPEAGLITTTEGAFDHDMPAAIQD